MSHLPAVGYLLSNDPTIDIKTVEKLRRDFLAKEAPSAYRRDVLRFLDRRLEHHRGLYAQQRLDVLRAALSRAKVRGSLD